MGCQSSSVPGVCSTGESACTSPFCAGKRLVGAGERWEEHKKVFLDSGSASEHGSPLRGDLRDRGTPMGLESLPGNRARLSWCSRSRPAGEPELGWHKSQEVLLPAAESHIASAPWLRECSCASPACLMTLWASEGWVLVSGLPLFTAHPAKPPVHGAASRASLKRLEPITLKPHSSHGLRDKNLSS